MKDAKVHLNFTADEAGNVIWAHPALSVGSSYCNLKEEARLWLQKNNQMGYNFSLNQEGYYLYFRDAQEAVLFSLRWS